MRQFFNKAQQGLQKAGAEIAEAARQTAGHIEESANRAASVVEAKLGGKPLSIPDDTLQERRQILATFSEALKELRTKTLAAEAYFEAYSRFDPHGFVQKLHKVMSYDPVQVDDATKKKNDDIAPADGKDAGRGGGGVRSDSKERFAILGEAVKSHQKVAESKIESETLLSQCLHDVNHRLALIQAVEKRLESRDRAWRGIHDATTPFAARILPTRSGSGGVAVSSSSASATSQTPPTSSPTATDDPSSAASPSAPPAAPTPAEIDFRRLTQCCEDDLKRVLSDAADFLWEKYGMLLSAQSAFLSRGESETRSIAERWVSKTRPTETSRIDSSSFVSGVYSPREAEGGGAAVEMKVGGGGGRVTANQQPALNVMHTIPPSPPPQPPPPPQSKDALSTENEPQLQPPSRPLDTTPPSKPGKSAAGAEFTRQPQIVRAENDEDDLYGRGGGGDQALDDLTSNTPIGDQRDVNELEDVTLGGGNEKNDGGEVAGTAASLSERQERENSLLD